MNGSSNQINDHDLLIVLNTKFDQMALDIKSVSDNLTVRVAKLEEHVAASDKLLSEIKPHEAIKMLERHDQYIHDQIHTNRLVKQVGSAVWGLLGMLGGAVIEWLLIHKPQ